MAETYVKEMGETKPRPNTENVQMKVICEMHRTYMANQGNFSIKYSTKYVYFPKKKGLDRKRTWLLQPLTQNVRHIKHIWATQRSSMANTYKFYGEYIEVLWRTHKSSIG